ncbi:MAG: CinA family protein [Thermoplasmata archaeon]|nr:CinA family protein [Thermoplasmata archaeon]
MNPEEKLGSLLTARTWTLAVAESCTGGLLAHTITNVPGSSTYFLGGMIAYSDSSKTEILGVPAETIMKNGAVSDRTAMAMAVGIVINFACDFGIAITGIAGPSGGSEQKPVGTVFVGVASEVGEKAKAFHFKGSREEIKAQSVKAAIEFACEFLMD